MPTSLVPDIVVGRLPTYLRALNQLLAEARQVTSSQELGDRLGISSAQIRKDLSHFGEFGKQGTGYNVEFLRDQLQQILNVDRNWPMVLIGAGDLGHAIANYQGFSANGFDIAAVFDNDANKIGQAFGEHTVRDAAEVGAYVKENEIRVAILAVSTQSAREVAQILVQHGIQAILNYAPVTLHVPRNVRVQYIDPVSCLQHMTYYLDESAVQ